MNYQNSSFNHDRTNVMTMEQLERVVEAILDGKYSWACLLILRSVGYNPMHYIPYRTYNRLMKEHLHDFNSKNNRSVGRKQENSPSNSKSRKLSESIEDLPYLESVDRTQVKVKGGFNSFSSYIFGVFPQDLDLR